MRKKVGGIPISAIAKLAPLFFGGKKRTTKPKKSHRKVGGGLGEILGNIGSGLGTGVGSGVRNIFSSLFGGKRRVGRPRKTKRKVGRGILSDLSELAKDTKIISKGIQKFGNPLGLAGAAGALGYGKKKPRSRRRVGGMSMSLMPAHTMPYHYVGGAGGII